jgi:hypothetical protein
MPLPYLDKLRGVRVRQDGVDLANAGRVLGLDFLDSVIAYDPTTGYAEIELGAGFRDFEIVSLSGAANTLALVQAHKFLRVSHTSTSTVTVPANATVAFPVGTEIALEQDGAGQLAIAAAGGVTIRTGSTLLARAQYSTLYLVKVATNEWVLLGDLQDEGYARVALTGQTASITTTALLTSPAAGLFEVDVYIETTTSGSAGTVLATIGHTDRIGATTQATSTLALDATGRKIQRFLVYAASGNITYATTVAGSAGSPQYALDIAIRRQSVT